MLNKSIVAAGLLLAGTASVHAAEYQVTPVAEGLAYPWSLAFLPDGGMLVTERAGRLRLINAAGELQAEPISGVPQAFVNSQAGLMGLALAPDFAKSGELFLSYACGTAEANHTCLASARFNGSALENTQEIFRVEPAKKGSAHYGGRIAFLADDTLLLTLGDGFDYREQAQNTANHLGSIVRLNRDGSAPQDNPFVGEQGAQPALYSIGHRNVQGLVVDADTGRVFSHEHGPRGGDEINLIEAGKNYGWPKITYGIDYDGAQISPYTELPGLEQPLLHWTPSIAPSGMTLYRGELFPQWQGNLLVSALAGKEVRRVMLKGNQVAEQESLFKELGVRFRDVRTGPDGALYLLTDSANGSVLRVTPTN
ncbi:PQQ-dependent sugar dehydrogenase [Halopseudomonas sabulinigri]|uniref:PQQ-dependent sugar dehydrogenase n=1 Tax=Halopseudomonas sabulinigri TaxID=472181 RepID=A0ABP9ZPA9_9GAMM